MATVELRLIDLNGHTVIDSRAVAEVPDHQADATEAWMRTVLAPADSEAWDLPLYGYRVQRTPLTA